MDRWEHTIIVRRGPGSSDEYLKSKNLISVDSIPDWYLEYSCKEWTWPWVPELAKAEPQWMSPWLKDRICVQAKNAAIAAL